MYPKNSVIVIAGSTASGKSQLAIDLSLELDGVAINADASQIYKDIGIIAASPSQEDKDLVEHRLYEYVDGNTKSNVTNWLNDVVAEIKRAWEKGKLPIIVGGSGLYIDNLINGVTPIPEVDKTVRQKVSQMLEEKGVEGLYEELELIDKDAAQMLNPQDTTRVKRALEIFLGTKMSISYWYQEPMIKKIPQANFFVIKLLPPKNILDARCDMRFDIMMNQGALKEVENLAKKNIPVDYPIMKAKGVPELLAYIDGKMSLEEAISLAKIRTRQYAKRQITWFKNKLDADVELLACYNGQKDFITKVKKQLQNRV